LKVYKKEVTTLNLSAKAGLVKPSPTLAITAKANALKAQGVDVVSFAAGEPDFNTPEPIAEAAIKAIHDGFTKYTPTSGINELKVVIANKLERENRVHVKPEQVVVSCGAKHSLYNTFQMLLDPGDEVIIFAPYWMTYVEQVILAGGTPVIVASTPEDEFVPSYEAIKEKITGRTKAILVNSPCNPTGAVFPRQTLKEIAQLAIRHELWVVCDEIYEKLIYGVEHVSIASLGSDIAERTITIGGCSKSYAMTGWRIGFAAAPLEIAKAMASFQDSVTSNPNSFAQKGAVVAFNMSPESIEKMRAEFEARRDLIRDELSAIPRLGVPNPKGSFYALVDFNAYLGGSIKTDMELAQYLLESFNVACIPGSVFEANGFLRLSYSTSRDNIKKGVSRIKEALSQIIP
jgi:aspartate aminotransferase